MKKKLYIILSMKELLYDVRSKAYIAGQSVATGENIEAVYNMQAVDDEGNADRIARSISDALARLKASFSEYIAGEDDVEADNLPEDAKQMVMLTFLVPSNFCFAAREDAARSMHGYIVACALSEWFSLTNKAEAASYAEQAAACLAEAHRAINRRMRPTRNS